MPFPKNQQIRHRGEPLGQAGTDDPPGFESKPMLDEKHGAGLRGSDKQQPALRDHSSDLRELMTGEPAETQRSPHQDAQHGADVRGNPPMVQSTDAIDSLPEGLQRERKGPYDKK